MRLDPVGRAWADSRIQLIFGGTTEIQKEIIAGDAPVIAVCHGMTLTRGSLE